MPTPSDFGDGSTVIEGATANTGYAHAHASRTSRGKGDELSPLTKTQSTFAKTTDYFSEERPYVVRIGTKGVIGALQELDQRLRQVRATTRADSCLTLNLWWDPVNIRI
jgi:hypothetical protein